MDLFFDFWGRYRTTNSEKAIEEYWNLAKNFNLNLSQMAIKFCEHRKVASQLPNPEDVLNGQVKKLSIKEKSAQYSFAVGLCYELADLQGKGDEKAFDKGVDLFFDFIMDNFEPELVIYSAKTVLSDHDIDIKPRKLAGKKEFKERYWKYLFPAS